LAIETLGGVATPMIPRNTTIPTSKTEVFSTAADNQTQVEIHVTQGERPLSRDNKDLGRFILDGIPPAPRGVPQIEVTFDIDASGILKITAKDKASGKSQNITITGAVGLSDDEIKKMQEDAEAHKAEDEAKAELINTRNSAEAIIITAEKALKDGGDKVSADIKSRVEEKIKALKDVKDSDDKEKIEAAMKDLSDTLSEIGQQMYGAQAQDKGVEDTGNSEEPKAEEKKENRDDVQEGEVVE
jgi:molecular chaperone DnaK